MAQSGSRTLQWRQAVWALPGLVVGAVAGMWTHWVSRAGGQTQFIATGMLAGAAVGLAVPHLRRSGKALDFEIGIPTIGTVLVKANANKRLLAAQLFHEASERIIGRPLEDGRGSIESACSSVYEWVKYRRELTRPVGVAGVPLDGATVESYTSLLLNDAIRPFTTKWHYEIQWYKQHHPDEHEARWPFNAEFRHDLKTLQYRARPYLDGLAKIGGVSGTESYLGPPPPPPEPLPEPHVPWHENPARLAPPTT